MIDAEAACRGRGIRPDVSQYRKPEKWLLNLFEDALKETLETTRLPTNVSKINDCMKRLDPTYKLSETGAFLVFTRFCFCATYTPAYACMKQFSQQEYWCLCTPGGCAGGQSVFQAYLAFLRCSRRSPCYLHHPTCDMFRGTRLWNTVWYTGCDASRACGIAAAHGPPASPHEPSQQLIDIDNQSSSMCMRYFRAAMQRPARPLQNANRPNLTTNSLPQLHYVT